MTPESTDIVRPLRAILELSATAEVLPVDASAEVESPESSAELLPAAEAEVRYRGL